jgi:integrase/recombinase XerD
MTKRAHVLTAAEFRRLLKIASTSTHAKRDTLLVLMSYGLGLRAVELAALTIGQVLHPNEEVRDSIYLTRTKNNIKRTAYLSDPTICKAILEYIEERKITAVKKRILYNHYQPLFLSQKRSFFTNDTLAKLFKHLYREAGIYDASSHSGRRTFATNLIEQGIDIKAVSTLMGHASIQMTALYIQDNPERLKKITSHALSFI